MREERSDGGATCVLFVRLPASSRCEVRSHPPPMPLPKNLHEYVAIITGKLVRGKMNKEQ